MKLPDFYANIQIDVEGDITKTRWLGAFRIKRVLTHKERFDIERYYKEIVSDDSSVSDVMKTRASVLAELRVRIQSGARWWEDSNYGMDLIDKTPLYSLLDQCNEAYKLWEKELEAMSKEPPKADAGA